MDAPKVALSIEVSPGVLDIYLERGRADVIRPGLVASEVGDPVILVAPGREPWLLEVILALPNTRRKGQDHLLVLKPPQASS